MSTATKIQCFDYVNHPYDRVCQALSMHSNEVFQQATKSAETRAESAAAGLHVKIAGIEFGKDVVIRIQSYVDIESRNERRMTVRLEWAAAETPRLFPVMEAQLHVYPITAKETQLEFQGEYEPPLGVLGKAIDAVVGHRIAEVSIQHFVAEVAEFLRNNIK